MKNPLSNPQAFAEYIRTNPQVMQQVTQSNPPLAEAILLNDIPKVISIISGIENNRRQQEAEKMRRIVNLLLLN